MLDKMERKFGRLAIPGLMNYIIAGYVIGYLVQFGGGQMGSNFAAMMTLEPFFVIHQYQIWRIFTWILIPPSRGMLWAVVMCFFYWQLGTQLERMWGTFKFNVYIFGGMFFTIVGAFLLYAYYEITGSTAISMGGYFSTYYINLSIFLAFALTIPDMHVLLYFCIPVKMKWLAIVYAVMIGFEFISPTTGWAGRVAILCSILNFIIFFFSSRDLWRPSARAKRQYGQTARRYRGYGPYPGQQRNTSGQTAQGGAQSTPWSNFGSAQNKGTRQIAKHRCAICGRTDITNPEMDFRFCSKCNGNYEYCSEHLFTHTHQLS